MHELTMYIARQVYTMDFAEVSFRHGAAIDRLCIQLNRTLDASVRYEVRHVFV
jgi:hypothetical protein